MDSMAVSVILPAGVMALSMCERASQRFSGHVEGRLRVQPRGFGAFLLLDWLVSRASLSPDPPRTSVRAFKT